MTRPTYFQSPRHLEWLAQHRQSLLDFYQPAVCLPSGGYAWLDDSGAPLAAKGAQLWLGARMLHVFSLAAMLGRPGAADVVEHGLSFYVDGPGHDDRYGGWYPVVGGAAPASSASMRAVSSAGEAG